MVVTKRKKHSRFRGYRTYHGSHKKQRGSGNRGGRGNIGLSRHKKGWMLKYDPDHFGKHGFKRHPSLIEDIKTLNLRELDVMVDKMREQKMIEQEGGMEKVVLSKIG